MTIPYASVFTGIGGFELGLQQAGPDVFQLQSMTEWDRNCQRLLRQYWPDTPLMGDVRDVRGADLGSIRLLLGGFPCKGTSVAQVDRRGIDDPDSESFQFFEFARLADESKPEWVVIENPDGLLTSPGRVNGVDKRGRDFAAVLGTLADLGYVGAYRVVDARHLGTTQRRRRILLVGHRGGDPRAVWEVLGDDGAGAQTAASHRVRTPGSRGPAPVAGPAGRSGALIWRKSARPRAALSAGGYETWVSDGDANTLTGFDGGLATRQTHLVAQHDRLRTLTLTEWERLQGFPDGWTVPLGGDSARYLALGNAIHVGTAAWLARRLARHLSATPVLA